MPEPDPKLLSVIAERLKSARVKKGVTQAQVARDLGLAEMTISRYERALHMPESPIAKQLADYYGVSLAWVLGSDAETADEELVRDDVVLRAVEEFLEMLTAAERAEYDKHDADWGRGLAFTDLRHRLGIENIRALWIRDLWQQRRNERAGRVRSEKPVPVAVGADKRRVPRKPTRG